jgi:hypothetical protein
MNLNESANSKKTVIAEGKAIDKYLKIENIIRDILSETR